MITFIVCYESFGDISCIQKELKRIREENDEENVLRGEQDDNESEDVEVAAVAVSTEQENVCLLKTRHLKVHFKFFFFTLRMYK